MSEVIIRGRVVLIDDTDIPLLVGRKWGIQFAPNGRVYVRSTNPQPQIYLHRLLLNAAPGADIDHINGNSLDNRRCNLRTATRSQNNANGRWDNPTGFRGVALRKNGRFVAKITIKGYQSYLGSFGSAEEAARAYDAAALALYGEFARLNFRSLPF